MQWISTEGGPLIIVGQSELPNWQGVDNDDYDRACSVEAYLGQIPVGNAQAIVLGDDPGQAAIFTSAALGIVVVRWLYADNASAVEWHLSQLTNFVFCAPCEESVFSASESRYFMFDSAENGLSAVGLVLSLPANNYAIKTAVYEPDSEVSLVLHQFSPA